MVQLKELYREPEDGRSSPAERAILRAGIRLFGHRGFGSTSVRQIATEAGVTPPLISYHFESKEGLFLACASIAALGMSSTVMEEIGASKGLSDLVLRVARAHASFPEQHPDAVRLLLSIGYGPDDGHPEVDLASAWVQIMDALQEQFRVAIVSGEFVPRGEADPLQLTRHLFNLLHMAVFDGFGRARFCSEERLQARFRQAQVDPGRDLHDQFFFGAGILAVPESHSAEEMR